MPSAPSFWYAFACVTASAVEVEATPAITGTRPLAASIVACTTVMRCAWFAIGDVVFDGVVEQHRILGHDADRAAQRFLRHIAQVLSVNGDAAVIDIVKAEQQA